VTDALAPILTALRSQQRGQSSQFAIGTLTSITGGYFVQFDGEGAASTRAYKRLSSYTGVVADRVLLAQSGTTWVILGKVV
jgi:hypothetical protein